MSNTRKLETQCVIAGGGPAGLMTGYLLARQGVNVIVAEKHADFLRDFRGDTVHPSTLELFHDLGLLDELLLRPHQKTQNVSLTIAGRDYKIAEFEKLPVRCKYVAMMPQWDFLDCLADAARKLSNFRLLQSTKVENLLQDNGRVVGVSASDKDGEIEIRAGLTIAADGRGSTLRGVSGLKVLDLGAPIDVFWMRLAREEGDSNESFGRVSSRGLLIQINRGDYWQCALPFPKGGAETIRAEGLPDFRQRISDISPTLEEAASAIQSWDQVKLLTVQVNRLQKWWREGLLCIGDAAHAMSPVGGVGINLAVQDAVAAARILGPAILDGDLSNSHLAAVQKRRFWPAKMTQKAQIAAHNRVLIPALNSTSQVKVPLAIKALNKFGFLRGLPARAIGLGLRPEHWRE